MAAVARMAAAVVCLPSSSSACRAAPLPWSRGGVGVRRRRTVARAARRRGRRPSRRGLVIVDEFGGQYEEGFEDVHTEIMNYFTYKATSTVLHQLYEMKSRQRILGPITTSWLTIQKRANISLSHSQRRGKIWQRE